MDVRLDYKKLIVDGNEKNVVRENTLKMFYFYFTNNKK